MFGPVRAAHLRTPAANTDQDMQLYNRRNKAVAALAPRGRHAPVDFAPDIIFYSSQQDHHAMLRSLALTERKLEDWAYGFGRWSIPRRTTRATRATTTFKTCCYLPVNARQTSPPPCRRLR